MESAHRLTTSSASPGGSNNTGDMSDRIDPVDNSNYDNNSYGNNSYDSNSYDNNNTTSNNYNNKGFSDSSYDNENNSSTMASDNTARRPSVQEQEAAVADADRRGSLGSTPNPAAPREADPDMNQPNGVGQQNAPGSIGKIGESIIGGLGYGGSTVERPKEEQGLAEKIVNFLGA